ncbi:trypsin-7-like [Frieseomelitta varia]|uniref:trypsin-7-like n=1 Tax=Frieseomelitta varia TaxID=561572 RepID=UPI001CB695D5|nr:trypsin-7-like [Frieseomelitta varia]
MLRMLVLLFVAQQALCFGPRIIGGDNASINDYPYQVSIHDRRQLLCGGSLISQNWVLTAAHCVSGLPPSQLKIRLGSSYNSKEGIMITEKLQVILHSNYNENTKDYDAALIKLPQSVTTNANVKPIALASSANTIQGGTKAVVTGWGYVAPGGPISDRLKSLTLPVVDQATCKKIYGNLLTDNMLCAGIMSGGKDACSIDSGGPLVYNKVQIGIVSWGWYGSCAKPQYPGVYTRVSAIRQWIKDKAQV